MATNEDSEEFICYQFTTMVRHTQKAKPVQGVSLQNKHKETIIKLYALSTT